MIIVSQNGKNIINLDNVTNIGIQDQTYNLDSRDAGTEIEAVLTCAKSIIAWFSNNKSIILGSYPSLDRAKEILKEIYKYKDELEHTNFLGYTEAFWKSTTFEMPEK